MSLGTLRWFLKTNPKGTKRLVLYYVVLLMPYHSCPPKSLCVGLEHIVTIYYRLGPNKETHRSRFLVFGSVQCNQKWVRFNNSFYLSGYDKVNIWKGGPNATRELKQVKIFFLLISVAEKKYCFVIMFPTEIFRLIHGLYLIGELLVQKYTVVQRNLPIVFITTNINQASSNFEFPALIPKSTREGGFVNGNNKVTMF